MCSLISKAQQIESTNKIESRSIATKSSNILQLIHSKLNKNACLRPVLFVTHISGAATILLLLTFMCLPLTIFGNIGITNANRPLN